MKCKARGDYSLLGKPTVSVDNPLWVRRSETLEIKVISILAGIVVILGVLVYYVFHSSTKRVKRKKEAEATKRARSLMAEGKHSQATASLIAAGKLNEAMDNLVSQGDYRGAGRVALRMKHPLRAGELFERAKDYEAAATSFLKIPDFRRAAECFARGGIHDKASDIYVQIGDIWAAAEELVAAGLRQKAAALHRQLGNDIIASRLTGEDLMEKGQFLEAAEAMDEAGENEAMAECLIKAGQDKEAAEAYQNAGRPDLAAQLFEKCGATSAAAAMYEEAGNHQAAARLYQDGQDPAKEVEALVAAGEVLAAGHLAYKLGNKERAEEILKISAPADKGYVRSCLLLGKILEESDRMREGLKYYTLFVERGMPSEKTMSVWEYLVSVFEKNRLLDVAIYTLRKLEGADMLDDDLRASMDRAVTMMNEKEDQVSVQLEDSEDESAEVPSQLSERYDVMSRLGEGGTAVVYLAVDKILKRDVVLKILSNPSLPGELAEEYFIREAQIVAGMSHPNIVTVFDVGNAGKRMYQVMEYIEGRSLDEVLSHPDNTGFPLDRVVEMASEIAGALAYAHERKIIHRDVKPGNIMVLSDDRLKLMDFGMAKALEIHRDRSAYICGTPDYMSPEQEAGDDLTIASDIYSFGLVLIECLLGDLPSTMSAQASRVKRIEALSQAGLPADVEQILDSCLSLEIDSRPASAKIVADGLRKCVSG